ncbi:putative leader peptide [Rhodococcus sp. NPDC003318]
MVQTDSGGTVTEQGWRRRHVDLCRVTTCLCSH